MRMVLNFQYFVQVINYSLLFCDIILFYNLKNSRSTETITYTIIFSLNVDI